MLLPTSLVGSYPQPDWLIDRTRLSAGGPPRIRVETLWRPPVDLLPQAQDDATLLAIRDQERAGLDIITDGEIRRESYSNRFATALEGIDLEQPGTVPGRRGAPTPVPRVVGRIRRVDSVETDDVRLLRANTDRLVKVTLPGPFTLSQQAQNDFYANVEDLAQDYAVAVNAEIRDLFAAGADIVQLDEPWMESWPSRARDYGLDALNRALEGITGTTAVHTCFGYGFMNADKPTSYAFLAEFGQTPIDQISIETAQSQLDCAVLSDLAGKTIVLGVLDLSTPAVETAETVAMRIRRALPYVAPERLVLAPDCGMKYLPREAAFGKLQAMVAGAEIVRRELS